MARRSAWLALVALSFPAPLYAQGALERIRATPRHEAAPAVTTPDHGPQRTDQSNWASGGNGADGEGWGALIGLGLIGATSPFWLPPMAMDDHYNETAYFTPYPYARFASAFLHVLPEHIDPTAKQEASFTDPNYLKKWSVRVALEDGNDFNGLNRLGAHAVVDTAWRFGLRTDWDWYHERLRNGGGDDALLGNTNVMFRFAQCDWLQMYAGVGCRAMEDRRTDRWGFNFTYGAEAFPVWPLVLATSIDLGNLGEAFVVQVRGTAGWAWRHGEVFVGYNFLRIGEVNLQGSLAGVRLWF